MNRMCRYCGREIPADNSPDSKRLDAEFCSDVCRTNYHNQRRAIDRQSKAVQRNMEKLMKSIEFPSLSLSTEAIAAVEKQASLTSEQIRQATEKLNTRLVIDTSGLEALAAAQKHATEIGEQARIATEKLSTRVALDTAKYMEILSTRVALDTAKYMEILAENERHMMEVSKRIAKIIKTTDRLFPKSSYIIPPRAKNDNE